MIARLRGLVARFSGWMQLTHVPISVRSSSCLGWKYSLRINRRMFFTTPSQINRFACSDFDFSLAYCAPRQMRAAWACLRVDSEVGFRGNCAS